MSVGLALVCTHSLYCGISTVSLLNLTQDEGEDGKIMLIVGGQDRCVAQMLHQCGGSEGAEHIPASRGPSASSSW